MRRPTKPRVYVAMVVQALIGFALIFSACGEEEAPDPFTKEEARAFIEKAGYTVHQCYPETGGNYDCLIDNGIWMHVRDSGTMQLTKAREDVKIDDLLVPEETPTPTPTPEPEEEFVP